MFVKGDRVLVNHLSCESITDTIVHVTPFVQLRSRVLDVICISQFCTSRNVAQLMKKKTLMYLYDLLLASRMHLCMQ